MDINVTSDGTGFGTSVAADGRPMRGLCAIEIAPINGPDDIVTAKLRFDLLRLDMVGKGTAHIAHPETGEIKEVASIRFADGSEFTF